MRIALAALVALWVPAAAQDPEHLGKPLAEWRSDLAAPEGVSRLLAIRSIGEMAVARVAGAEDALMEALSHDDSSVRFWAATAAVSLPEQSLGRATGLLRALEDPVPEVRVQAARGLIGTESEQAAFAALAEMLSHRNRGVRLHAAHAADALGTRAAPLAAALRRAVEDDFDYVQRVARHALWTLGERPCPYRECE